MAALTTVVVVLVVLGLLGLALSVRIVQQYEKGVLFRLDQTLAETDTINLAIREILDVTTEAWGVVVTLVELKDIQLPETMQRAMARQAEATLVEVGSTRTPRWCSRPP